MPEQSVLDSFVGGSEDEDQGDDDGLDLARKPWKKEVICTFEALLAHPPRLAAAVSGLPF